VWVWIVIGIVVIGGILAFWILNAARLADKNGNLRPRSPRLFDARASDRHQQPPAGQERPDPGRRPE